MNENLLRVSYERVPVALGRATVLAYLSYVELYLYIVYKSAYRHVKSEMEEFRFIYFFIFIANSYEHVVFCIFLSTTTSSSSSWPQYSKVCSASNTADLMGVGSPMVR